MESVRRDIAPKTMRDSYHRVVRFPHTVRRILDRIFNLRRRVDLAPRPGPMAVRYVLEFYRAYQVGRSMYSPVENLIDEL